MPLFHSVAFPQMLGYSCFPARLCFGNLCLFWKDGFGCKIITMKEHHQWDVMAVGLLPTLGVSLNSSGHVPDSQTQISPPTAPAWGQSPLLSTSQHEHWEAGGGWAGTGHFSCSKCSFTTGTSPALPSDALCQPKPV